MRVLALSGFLLLLTCRTNADVSDLKHVLPWNPSVTAGIDKKTKEAIAKAGDDAVKVAGAGEKITKVAAKAGAKAGDDLVKIAKDVSGVAVKGADALVQVADTAALASVAISAFHVFGSLVTDGAITVGNGVEKLAAATLSESLKTWARYRDNHANALKLLQCEGLATVELQKECKELLLSHLCSSDECKQSIEWDAMLVRTMYPEFEKLANEFHNTCLNIKSQSSVKRYRQCKKDVFKKSCLALYEGDDQKMCMEMIKRITSIPERMERSSKAALLEPPAGKHADVAVVLLPETGLIDHVPRSLDTHDLLVDVLRAQHIESAAWRLFDGPRRTYREMTASDQDRSLYVVVASGEKKTKGSWATEPTDWNPSDTSVHFQAASHVFFDHEKDRLFVGMLERRSLTAMLRGDPEVGWGQVELNTSFVGDAPKTIDVPLYRDKRQTALLTICLQAFEKKIDDEAWPLKTEL